MAVYIVIPWILSISTKTYNLCMHQVSKFLLPAQEAYLELCESVRVVGEAQGVEALSGVDTVQPLAGGTSLHPVALDGSHQDDLQ